MKVLKRGLTPEDVFDSFSNQIHNEYLGKGKIAKIEWNHITQGYMTSKKESRIDIKNITILVTIEGLTTDDGRHFSSTAQINLCRGIDYSHYYEDYTGADGLLGGLLADHG